jgi:hypothetical protein
MAQTGGLSVRIPVHQVVDGTWRVSAAHDVLRYVITGDLRYSAKILFSKILANSDGSAERLADSCLVTPLKKVSFLPTEKKTGARNRTIKHRGVE